MVDKIRTDVHKGDPSHDDCQGEGMKYTHSCAKMWSGRGCLSHNCAFLGCPVRTTMRIFQSALGSFSCHWLWPSLGLAGGLRRPGLKIRTTERIGLVRIRVN